LRVQGLGFRTDLVIDLYARDDLAVEPVPIDEEVLWRGPDGAEKLGVGRESDRSVRLAVGVREGSVPAQLGFRVWRFRVYDLQSGCVKVRYLRN